MRKMITMSLFMLCLLAIGCSHALVSNSYEKTPEQGQSSSYVGKGSSKSLQVKYNKAKPKIRPAGDDIDDVIIEDTQVKRYKIIKQNGKVIIQVIK